MKEEFRKEDQRKLQEKQKREEVRKRKVEEEQEIEEENDRVAKLKILARNERRSREAFLKTQANAEQELPPDISDIKNRNKALNNRRRIKHWKGRSKQKKSCHSR